MTHTCRCDFKRKLILLKLIVIFSITHVFAQVSPPVITSFSPANGPVGTTVTIAGTGFNAIAANNIVFFGATMAKVTSAGTTSLTVTVPSGATYKPITVLNGNNALAGYSAKPFITTFAPAKGAITRDDFNTGIDFNTGGYGPTMAIGDIDGDGKPDLVIANGNGNAVSILRNTSVSGSITASSFALKVDFAAPRSPITVALADLDGDGKLDVVITNAGVGPNGQPVSIFRNRSRIGSIDAGSLAPAIELITQGGSAIGLALGDIDGDGKTDIVVANNQLGAAISIWRNNSTPGSITAGSFDARTDIQNARSLQNGGENVAIADLDGDGKPDIVITDELVDMVTVFRNTSRPGLIDNQNSFLERVAFSVGKQPFDVAIGDLDGDGKPDIAVTNSLGGTISVLKNTSASGALTSGSFAPVVNFPTPNNPRRVTIADLDGDGKPDLAATMDGSIAISVLRNTTINGAIAAGSFAPAVNFTTPKLPLAVAAADFDGDGKTDLAVTAFPGNFTGNTVTVYRNNPVFPPKVQATNVVFSNTAQNTTTVGWSNGNGTARAVFISTTSTGSPLPVSSTTYAAHPIFGLGTQIATSGWYCVYNGTGNTVNLTGLSSGATYRVMVVEYTGTPGGENYLTAPAAGNPGNVTTLPGGAIAINTIALSGPGNTNTNAVQFTATFAAPVTGLTAANFALVTTGNINGAGVTSVTGSGATYTVTVSTGTGDGTIGLNLANATGLTPGIISPLPFAGRIYSVDRTLPAVTISAPSVNNILSGTSTINYTVTYADANFNASTLTGSNITLNSIGSATGAISVAGSGTTYTVTISDITGSGSLGISIAAATASDLAGNQALASDPSATFLVAPVLTDLKITSGTLSPVFTGTTLDYTAIVNNATATLTVTPITSDPKVILKVNNSDPAATVNLVVGTNSIVVDATTLDGKSTTTYTIDVIRAAPVITGDAPNIAYGTGNLVVANAIAFTATPTNTGGAVPKTNYGQVSTFAGSPTETAGYLDGTGTAALFNFPQQMVKDISGNLYVTDANNQAIRKITTAGVVTTYAGSLTGEAGLQDGQGTSALFNFPDGIAIDGADNLYVSDYSNNAIRKITPSGQVSTFYSSLDTFGPGGLCFDNSDNLIVAAQDASQVIKISPAGVATVVAGSLAGYVNGPVASTQFDTPTDVKVDDTGNIYVVDFNNNAVRRITPAGTVSTIAGSDISGNTPGYADGVGTAAVFNNPAGIILGSGGMIYVTDVYNNDIRQIMPDGTVSLLAGTASQVPGDSDGVGTAAGFNQPVYLYNDGSGTAYVSELAANRIRKLTLTGYTLSGNLPAALIFDPTTGIISGTVSDPFTPQTVTITAYNAFGFSATKVTLTYQAVSAVATLSDLKLSSGALAPDFNDGTTNYAANVLNSTASITVTPTATDEHATIKVNGATVASGAASVPIELKVGPNTITTVVTAQDGSTTQTYTVTLTRAASTDASLSSLTISNGTLAPVFASGTLNYSAAVANSVSFLTVTPTRNDPNATITVNGAAVASGTASAAITLNVGPNIISTLVIAQDGTTKETYSITVTRAASSDATLADLRVSEGTLSPAFTTGTTAYADTVSNSVFSITVTPTANDRNATITVNGNTVVSGTSGAIPLMAGENTITVVVTAQDGVTTDTYTVNVYKGEAIADISSTNILTPNGDGKNDYWLIKDIQLYPQNNVRVYDKGGRIVYNKNGYNNEWDGTLNGSPLAEGTYYFVVDLGPKLRKFKGYISILRN